VQTHVTYLAPVTSSVMSFNSFGYSMTLQLSGSADRVAKRGLIPRLPWQGTFFASRVSYHEKTCGSFGENGVFRMRQSPLLGSSGRSLAAEGAL
jgi:hypothetical protein